MNFKTETVIEGLACDYFMSYVDVITVKYCSMCTMCFKITLAPLIVDATKSRLSTRAPDVTWGTVGCRVTDTRSTAIAPRPSTRNAVWKL